LLCYPGNCFGYVFSWLGFGPGHFISIPGLAGSQIQQLFLQSGSTSNSWIFMAIARNTFIIIDTAEVGSGYRLFLLLHFYSAALAYANSAHYKFPSLVSFRRQTFVLFTSFPNGSAAVVFLFHAGNEKKAESQLADRK
jgi:hypothetical protein